MAFSKEVLEQITAYAPKLVAFVHHLTRRVDDCQDIAQEAILRALNKDQEPRDVPVLLRSIARNVASEVRKTDTGYSEARDAALVARRCTFNNAQTYENFFNGVQSAVSDQFTAMQVTEVVSAVTRMKPVFRRDFHLHCIQGLAFAEMAQITGETPHAHKLRFQRLKKNWAKRVSQSSSSSQRRRCRKRQS